MKTKLTGKAIAATTLTISAISAGAQNLPPTTAITFDPDGNGGLNGASAVQTFDWSNSSNLVLPGFGAPNTNPIPPTQGPTSLNVLTHATLRGFLKPSGNPAPAPVGLGSAFEITFVAGACTTATPTGSIVINGIPTAPTINLALDPACGGIPSPDVRNFFEIWYDDFSVGTPSDSLSGSGFRDGKLIARGTIVDLLPSASVSITGTTTEIFDQYVGDNYGGKQTAIFEGSQDFVVMVTDLDKTFFTAGVDKGSLALFTNQTRVPFKEVNPSLRFYSGLTPPSVGTVTTLPPDELADLGVVNGVGGPDTELQTDGSHAFIFIPPALACRVTGGGNDTAGIATTGIGWDGTMALDSLMSAPITTGKGKNLTTTTSAFVYTFGGQAGANTAQPPQPKGEWEHQNHDGPNGLQFDFKIGTSSAPKGTKIAAIACSDEGYCRPARPAPDKQIDFVGTGSFTSISNNTTAAVDNVHTFPGITTVVPVPSGKRDKNAIPTYHWFQVHIEDLGEPGSKGLTDADDVTKCKPGGSGNNPFADPPILENKADCDCADFYRMTIYKGFTPVLDADGNITNTGDINKTEKIYEVYGYINGGNFQIHPPTGFDLK